MTEKEYICIRCGTELYTLYQLLKHLSAVHGYKHFNNLKEKDVGDGLVKTFESWRIP